MTVQLVLNEGSNVITIFTPIMSTSRSVDLITQGIENSDGTDAAFDSTFHPIFSSGTRACAASSSSPTT